jgi:hypothetical protein
MMRALFATITLVLAGLGVAHAQTNTPPLLIPAPPAPPPPPLFVPPPVPSVVTPLPTPSYGVPSNINSSTPLSSSSRAIYRQPKAASPRDRVARRKHFRKRRHTAN